MTRLFHDRNWDLFHAQIFVVLLNKLFEYNWLIDWLFYIKLLKTAKSLWRKIMKANLCICWYAQSVIITPYDFFDESICYSPDRSPQSTKLLFLSQHNSSYTPLLNADMLSNLHFRYRKNWYCSKLTRDFLSIWKIAFIYFHSLLFSLS